MPGDSKKRAPLWGKRFLFLFFILSILVSNGCTLPGTWRPTDEVRPTNPTPTPAGAGTPNPTQAAVSPQPTGAPKASAAPAVALPPALVEFNPAPRSDIGPKTAFTFYFNQPMERGSVQEALQAQPALAGSFKWADDTTVTFTPDKPLTAGSGVQVSFSTRARAANGLALTAPVDVSFQVSNGFALAEQLPKPGSAEVSAASAVAATFTRPVVPLGADAKDLPAPFSLEPAAQGRGEWLNTSTFIFYPDPALQGGVEYSVRLNTGLTSLDGTGWAEGAAPASWKFKTALPAVLSASPDGKAALALDAPLTLTFNQPMDTASVQAALTVKLAGGETAAGKLEWNETATSLTWKPDALLKRASAYTLSLAGNAQALGGAALGKDFSITYTTVPNLGVKSSEPANGGTLQMFDVFGGIRIQFTAPLAKQDLSGLLTLQPAAGDPNISSFNESEVYLSGIFKPRTEYTLTIQTGLKDKWGQTLKEPVLIRFQTPAPEASLSMASSTGNGVVFLSPVETALAARATNLKTLRIGSAALTQADFARLASISSYQRAQSYTGSKLASFDKAVSLPADQNSPVDVPLNQAGKALATGLYYYQLQSPEVTSKNSQNPTGMLVVVSRIHLALKLSQSQLTAWAVNLDTHQPAKGAALTVFTSGQTGELTQVGTIQTDDQGVGTLNYAFPANSFTPTYVVMGKPGDPTFSLAMTDWNQGVSGWEFGLPVDVSAQAVEAYLYTDRPIYQPGQEVFFKGLIHQKNNGRYSLSNLKQVTAKVLGEYSRTTGERNTLLQVTLPVSAYGSINGMLRLPDTATPGFYTIELAEVSGSLISFQVANYRKPEVEIKAAFNAADLRAGQDMAASIQASYYFGAPAANLNLQWTLTTTQTWFGLPEGYQAGLLDTGWLLPRGLDGLRGGTRQIANGQLKTGPDGKGTIQVTGQQYLDAVDEQYPNSLVLQVTLQDEQELPVSTRAESIVHPADAYIGLRPDAWSGQAKQEAGFSVQTFQWNKTPAANLKLQAVFQKAVFKQKSDWNWQSDSAPYTLETTKVASTDFQVDAQGRARIAFTPPEPGTYLVEVSGNGARTQLLFWVGGEGKAPWPGLPDKRIRLLSDASSYQPGQTAKLFISNPLGEKTLAWITVERAKVMKTVVVPISGSSLEWSLPLTDDLAPNVFVSVLLVGQGAAGEPDFREGYLELNVSPKNLLLQVEAGVQPATASPGGEVKIGVRVKDSQGKPVQGEFSLSVVDKAVLALADPNAQTIQDAYYGRQSLGVNTSLSLAVYGRPRAEATPQAAGGRGGGGGDASAGVVRSDFQDTAYWNGTVLTDAGGYVEVAVKLPDNLTTWVVTVRGLSQDVRVGEATQQVVVTKDLLIRPVTPRFLVAGDRVQLAATLNNNTANAISVDVSLQASGLDLEDPSQALQKVNLPAQGRARVTWWGKTQADVDKVDLVFSAKGGGLEDAARPTGGSIPVQRYASPQTFATGGVLTEAGQRLELISLPRSYTPTGGELKVELSPSIAAAILSGLKALEPYPTDLVEPVVSHLLPNLAAYQALKKLSIDSPELSTRLEGLIQDSLNKLASWQNKDGGWGWSLDQQSDSYLTAYVLLGLSEAGKAGGFVDKTLQKKAADYLISKLVTSTATTAAEQVDRQVFQQYALQQAGSGQKSASGLYEQRERLAPWSKALLALTLSAQNAGDARARTLVSDLESQALRSATGAHWETANGRQINLGSPNFTTAVVSLAVAALDPASAVLVDAVRYLAYNRRPSGVWASSYESAWVLMALTEVMRSTGELSASFAYSAVLNNSPLASGQAGGPNALTPVEGRQALKDLLPDAPNGLQIVHAPGSGRLYYRAFLQVYRPVEQSPALQRGLTISRQYYLAGQDCTQKECLPVSSVKISDQREVMVRLTLTLPQAMYNLAVEDFIPAGAEIVDASLKTAPKADPLGNGVPVPLYTANNPFRFGWNWWLFGAPKIYNDAIRWTAPFLAAGTYELTYRLTPIQPGEFRLIPAHAAQTYFPEVEGSSAGAIFKIEP